MNKRIISFLLSILLFSAYIPVSFAEETIKEPILKYSINQEKQIDVSDKESRLNADVDVNKVKDLKSVTISLEFKITGNYSGIHNLIYVGKKGVENQYYNIYVIPSSNTIGMEIRGANGAHKVQNFKTNFNVNLSDGEWHKFAFTLEENDRYQLNLDGQYQGKRWSRSNTYWVDGLDLNGDVDVFSFGGGVRDGNSYTMTGLMKNVKVYDYALTNEQVNDSFNKVEIGNSAELVYEKNNFDLLDKEAIKDEELLKIKDLQEASVITRFKVENPNSTEKYSLFELKSEEQESGLYLIPGENKVIYKSICGEEIEFSLNKEILSNASWHTLGLAIGRAGTLLSIDGETISKNDNRIFVSDKSENITESVIGSNFNGGIDLLKVYKNMIDENTLNYMTSETKSVETLGPDPDKVYKTEDVPLFYPGLDSPYYRIPALITTKNGTIIAGADKRNTTEFDWGDIDAVIRRKEKGQDEFGDLITVMDLNDDGEPIFMIDMVLLPVLSGKNSGRIYMLMDMFPVGGSYWKSTHKTGYKEIDGTNYQIVEKDGQEYTVREKGVIYTPDGESTEYLSLIHI